MNKESPFIKYSKGYKYQLKEDAWFTTGLRGYSYSSEYITLFEDGLILIRRGYAWDGPSGPTWDTKSTLRGSLIHDVLYQLIRFEVIPRGSRIPADKEAKARWLTDGMWRIRAWIWTKMLSKHAALAAHPDRKRKIYTAP